jgi:hypothetical protein
MQGQLNKFDLRNDADTNEEFPHMQALTSHCNVQETRMISAFREVRQQELSIATKLVQL